MIKTSQLSLSSFLREVKEAVVRKRRLHVSLRNKSAREIKNIVEHHFIDIKRNECGGKTIRPIVFSFGPFQIQQDGLIVTLATFNRSGVPSAGCEITQTLKLLRSVSLAALVIMLEQL